MQRVPGGLRKVVCPEAEKTHCQKYGHFMLKFDKKIIGDYIGKQMTQVLTHMLQVKIATS